MDNVVLSNEDPSNLEVFLDHLNQRLLFIRFAHWNCKMLLCGRKVGQSRESLLFYELHLTKCSLTYRLKFRCASRRPNWVLLICRICGVGGTFNYRSILLLSSKLWLLQRVI